MSTESHEVNAMSEVIRRLVDRLDRSVESAEGLFENFADLPSVGILFVPASLRTWVDRDAQRSGSSRNRGGFDHG